MTTIAQYGNDAGVENIMAGAVSKEETPSLALFKASKQEIGKNGGGEKDIKVI